MAKPIPNEKIFQTKTDTDTDEIFIRKAIPVSIFGISIRDARRGRTRLLGKNGLKTSNKAQDMPLKAATISKKYVF